MILINCKIMAYQTHIAYNSRDTNIPEYKGEDHEGRF